MLHKLLVLGALFVLLTPGVVLSLPPGSSLLVQAVVHAVVFVLVWKLVLKKFLSK